MLLVLSEGQPPRERSQPRPDRGGAGGPAVARESAALAVQAAGPEALFRLSARKWTCARSPLDLVGPPSEHLDPHGGVDEYHRPSRPKLATGIRSHISQVAEPFDIPDMICQALNPPHAYGFLQREVHRRRVGLDTKNSNRLVQEILIKHKSCAFHVPMVVGKVAV